jgi:hypothetical protein
LVCVVSIIVVAGGEIVVGDHHCILLRAAALVIRVYIRQRGQGWWAITEDRRQEPA